MKPNIMNVLAIIFSFLIAVVLSGCGNKLKTLDLNSPSTNNDDLSQYFYHENLRDVGGRVSYVHRHYERPTGKGPIEYPTVIYQRTSAGIENSDVTGTVFARETINELKIVESGVSSKIKKTFDRYVKPGEVYTNGERQYNSLRETCTLKNHYDTFSIAVATAPVMISSDVYKDVIQVFCDSVFDSASGETKPNYSWDQYYAKGIGLIYLQGSWPNYTTVGSNFDDIFAIPLYED